MSGETTLSITEEASQSVPAIWQASVLSLAQLNIFNLISLKPTMDSSKFKVWQAHYINSAWGKVTFCSFLPECQDKYYKCFFLVSLWLCDWLIENTVTIISVWLCGENTFSAFFSLLLGDVKNSIPIYSLKTPGLCNHI